MGDLVTIELVPLGKMIKVAPSETFQDALFESGLEFPCGGRGLCRGCKVRVLAGDAPVSAEDRLRLTAHDIANGWRLACKLRSETDLKIEVGQWETPILADDSKFEFAPKDAVGIAIDLGTTTIAAQLVDLRTGQVLAVRTELNAQARHGGDIMSRVEFAVSAHRQGELESLVQRQIGDIAQSLLSAAGISGKPFPPLSRVLLAGNTVMHHLFSGIPVEPLSHYPFEPSNPGLQRLSSAELGWQLQPETEIVFLPCLGGFVGSDILAGILATQLDKRLAQQLLIDLGTNGEIVVGNSAGLLCASTAAGPAFEGARISIGMRAATGAISEVHADGEALRCHVLSKTKARGICGSGLVDAVAAGLALGKIRPNGRLDNSAPLPLVDGLSLNQWDIRELQLAKGAIAAGINLLLKKRGIAKRDLSRVHLAGAFGNYINAASARRIGLLDFEPALIVPAGNSALLGAKMALFLEPGHLSFSDLLGKVRHVSLHEDPGFQESYAEQMLFPAN